MTEPRQATKSDSEREDEEVERLSRPTPHVKPPRHDKRRERIETDTSPDAPKTSAERIADAYLSDAPPPTPLVKDQAWCEKAAEQLLTCVRGNAPLFHYLQEQEGWAADKTPLAPAFALPEGICTGADLARVIAQAGGIEVLEKQYKLPPKDVEPAAEAPPPVDPAMLAPAAMPRGEDIPPPAMPLPSLQDRRDAALHLVRTFPPALAQKLASLHPADVTQLIADYRAAGQVTTSLEDTLQEARTACWYALDPSCVQPPPGLVKTAEGEHLPFLLLSDCEQRRTMQAHRLQVVAYSLALRDRVSHAFETAGVSRALSPIFASLCLPPPRKGQEAKRADKALHAARQVFAFLTSPELPEGGEEQRLDAGMLTTASAEVPGLRPLLVAALLGQDYRDVAAHYLGQNAPKRLTEHMAPETFAKKLAGAMCSLYEKSASYPRDVVVQLGDPADMLRERVLTALRAIDPEKQKAVYAALCTMADILPELPCTAAGEHEARARQFATRLKPFDSSYRGAQAPMPSPPSSSPRHAAYHGVQPAPVAPYPGWSQAQARDLGASDEKTLLASAREWLRKPVLAQGMDGVRDAQLRAALDLAVRTADEGRYAGGLSPVLYNNLLARLAGEDPDETLLTIRQAAGRRRNPAMPTNTASAIRQMAQKLASGEITPVEASYDLIALSETVAGEMPPQFKENAEKKQEEAAAKKDEGQDQGQKQAQQDQGQQDQQQKQASGFRALKAALMSTAKANPQALGALKPFLQIVKNHGLAPRVPPPPLVSLSSAGHAHHDAPQVRGPRGRADPPHPRQAGEDPPGQRLSLGHPRQGRAADGRRPRHGVGQGRAGDLRPRADARPPGEARRGQRRAGAGEEGPGHPA